MRRAMRVVLVLREGRVRNPLLLLVKKQDWLQTKQYGQHFQQSMDQPGKVVKLEVS